MTSETKTVAIPAKKLKKIKPETYIWGTFLFLLSLSIWRFHFKINHVGVETERNEVATHDKLDSLMNKIESLEKVLTTGNLAETVERVKYILEKLERELYDFGKDLKSIDSAVKVSYKETDESTKFAFNKAHQTLTEITKLAEILRNDANKWGCQSLFVDEMRKR